MRKICGSIIFILLLFIISCTEGQRSWLAKFFKDSGKAVPVAVENIVLQERSVSNVEHGRLEPSETVEITLPYEVRIANVFFDIGNAVNKGDLLCQLSEADKDLRLSALRSELQELQSAYQKNLYFFNNRDRLLDEERIDQDQYDGLEEDVEKNEKDIEKMKVEISKVENNVVDVNVRSPISGVIQERFVSSGLIIQAGQPLFVITNINPIAVVFELAPYEAKGVSAGVPVTVRLRDLPGEVVNSKVNSVGSRINEETGRFEAKVLIPNANNIYKTGMIVQVEYDSPEKQGFFSVPEEAVISDRNRQYVFTVSMGIAHKVPVVVRDVSDGRAEIVKGLVENDIVVVKGNQELVEGSVVEIWGR